MFTNPVFCLSGVGYLHVVHQNDGVHARINVIYPLCSGTTHKDDVWIDCIVNDDNMLWLLNELESDLRKSKPVIVQFDVEYSGFGFSYAGIEDDPDCIICVKGKLLYMHEYLINIVSLNDKRSVSQQRPTIVTLGQCI